MEDTPSQVSSQLKYANMGFRNNSQHILFALFPFAIVKNFDRSPTMLKIFALPKEKIAE